MLKETSNTRNSVFNSRGYSKHNCNCKWKVKGGFILKKEGRKAPVYNASEINKISLRLLEVIFELNKSFPIQGSHWNNSLIMWYCLVFWKDSLLRFDLSMLRGRLNNLQVPNKFKSFINKGEKNEACKSQALEHGKRKSRKNGEKKFHVTWSLPEISSSPRRISIPLVEWKNPWAAPTVEGKKKELNLKYDWFYNDRCNGSLNSLHHFKLSQGFTWKARYSLRKQ